MRAFVFVGVLVACGTNAKEPAVVTIASSSATGPASPTPSISLIADTNVCPRLAISFVVDRSGSMTGQPLLMAQAATKAAVDLMTKDDCIAVIAFDSQPKTIVKLGAVKDAGAVKAAIDDIKAGGGTEILSAIDMGQHALDTAGRAKKKHVVLLTDGMAPAAGLRELVQSMVSKGTSLTTIGLGTGVDEQTLRMLSDTGNGRYYHVIDPTALTRVFVKEVEMALE